MSACWKMRVLIWPRMNFSTDSRRSMAYRIITSRRASKKIKNTINYYALYNNVAPINFSAVLKEAFDTLRTYPFFAVKYKNVRTLKLKRFPYSLYFTVNDKMTRWIFSPASTTSKTLIEGQSFNKQNSLTLAHVMQCASNHTYISKTFAISQPSQRNSHYPKALKE